MSARRIVPNPPPGLDPRTGRLTKERRTELADRARENLRGKPMSDRPMAQRHEFTTTSGHEVVAIVFDPECPEWPDIFGEYGEQDLTLELLRVVAERDEARQALQEVRRESSAR